MPLKINIADTPFKRLVGLIGKRYLPANQALLLPGCRQIHTWFMRFPIDVLFLDNNGRVLQIIEALPPWRFSPLVVEAAFCLEIAAFTAKRQRFSPGVCISF